MDRQTSIIIARVLGLVGVLFMLAMAFDMMPRKYALFAGIACFVVAGFVWGMTGRMTGRS
jgi:hypothetical protein